MFKARPAAPNAPDAPLSEMRTLMTSAKETAPPDLEIALSSDDWIASVTDASAPLSRA